MQWDLRAEKLDYHSLDRCHNTIISQRELWILSSDLWLVSIWYSEGGRSQILYIVSLWRCILGSWYHSLTRGNRHHWSRSSYGDDASIFHVSNYWSRRRVERRYVRIEKKPLFLEIDRDTARKESMVWTAISHCAIQHRANVFVTGMHGLSCHKNRGAGTLVNTVLQN